MKFLNFKQVLNVFLSKKVFLNILLNKIVNLLKLQIEKFKKYSKSYQNVHIELLATEDESERLF